jgi:hypothetical protein
VVRWLRSEEATFLTMEGLLHKTATFGIHAQYRYSGLNLNSIKRKSSGTIYYAYVPLDGSLYQELSFHDQLRAKFPLNCLPPQATLKLSGTTSKIRTGAVFINGIIKNSHG